MENKIKHIYVAYVGIGSVEDENSINKLLYKVYENVSTIINRDDELVVIPKRNTIDINIQCINPEYITNEELIRKNRLLIDELHEHMDNKLKEIKEERD